LTQEISEGGENKSPPNQEERRPWGRFLGVIFAVAVRHFRFIFRQRDMTRQQVLDLYFLDARHKLVELAAFLDRVEQAEGTDDFRLQSFRAALVHLGGRKRNRAKRVLLAFSDLSAQPVAIAGGKGACGAWQPIK
jgi:hypothetical protein